MVMLAMICTRRLVTGRDWSIREESEHRSAVRRIPAFQTMATLCQLAAEARVGGQPSPAEVLREATVAPLQSLQAQERPEQKGKGRSHRQVICSAWLMLCFERCLLLYFVSCVTACGVHDSPVFRVMCVLCRC